MTGFGRHALLNGGPFGKFNRAGVGTVTTRLSSLKAVPSARMRFASKVGYVQLITSLGLEKGFSGSLVYACTDSEVLFFNEMVKHIGSIFGRQKGLL